MKTSGQLEQKRKNQEHRGISNLEKDFSLSHSITKNMFQIIKIVNYFNAQFFSI